MITYDAGVVSAYCHCSWEPQVSRLLLDDVELYVPDPEGKCFSGRSTGEEAESMPLSVATFSDVSCCEYADLRAASRMKQKPCKPQFGRSTTSNMRGI